MTAPGAPGLGAALAAIVSDHLDVADTLARLLADCAEAVGASSAAILAQEADGHLGLLAATTHRAAEIEMFQAQQSSGPCVDALSASVPVTARGEAELIERWGEVGSALTSAGFRTVAAFPMRWRRLPIGGLNLFWESETDPRVAQAVGQVYADVATLVLVGAAPLAESDLHRSLHDALAEREVVEIAKGVLAHARGLSLEDAYADLLRICAERGQALTAVAEDVVRHRGADLP